MRHDVTSRTGGRRHRRQHAWLAIVPALAAAAAAGAQRAPDNGMRPAELRTHAIVGGTVVASPGERIEAATVVIRDGVIEAVGTGIAVPPEARIWDAEGLTIYPGLIEPALVVEPKARPESARRHWNAGVRPERRMADETLDAGVRESFRALGFTAAAIYPAQGIFRGTGTVVALGDEAHPVAYRDGAALAIGLGAPMMNERDYPSSLMGVIGLIRQTFLDARWHAACRHVYEQFPEGNEPPAPSDALHALGPALDRGQRVLFDVSSEADALRAGSIAEEFDLEYALLGSGFEFRRLDEIAGLRAPIIVPLRFPDAPGAASLAQADRVTLREMMSWEQAPTNARRLREAGVDIALTTHRLRHRRDFPAALRRAILHGLTEDDALAALTIAPARQLGLDHVMGTISPGRLANMVVVQGSLFDKGAVVRDVWINGRRYEIEKAPDPIRIAGVLRAEIGGERVEVEVEIDTEARKASFSVGGDAGEPATVEAKSVSAIKGRLAIVVEGRALRGLGAGAGAGEPDAAGAQGDSGWARLAGAATDGAVVGTGELPDGRRFAFVIEPREAEPQGASAPGGPEAAAAAEASDAAGVPSGVWLLRGSLEGTSDPLDAKLSLTLDRSGALRGWLAIGEQEAEIDSGNYDRDAKSIRCVLTSAAGGTSILDATIDREQMAVTLSGSISARLTGVRTAVEVAETGEGAHFVMPPQEIDVPFGAFGFTEAPAPQSVLIRGATIWTCGPAGVIENGALLVEEGRVAFIGRADEVPASVESSTHSIVVIDGSGRHVTPGLIDCHSHTGIDGGVNEMGQANTAEVRIADVVDPDDVNWYRELAGGLTAANQLHGSANPIGGQNSVVKLRWGGRVRDFPVAEAKPGIKFALGENVKRAQGRYPNTRMGVETFIRDAFTAAHEYRAEHDRWAQLDQQGRARTMPPRRDLELETLAEILAGERIVHCHSYRQDEILMLIRVAEEFGFTIGTFQHVLEGYKVADAIAAHGAGGSSFSDWWAYKVEVMDAIPYNGALMTRVGVLTSFNSDSNELARRMNTEAAKAVRYGGLSPEEALALVTINPARQLGIADRCGSLEPGKDGDFVIWSGDPLSTYTKCEETWIEGVRRFSLEADLVMRERAAAERRRLIQRILEEQHGEVSVIASAGGDGEGAPGASGGAGGNTRARAYIEACLSRGEDPFEQHPGDCGCGGLRAIMLEEAR